MTRHRTTSGAALALVLGLSLAATGCGKYSWSKLVAQKSYKDANALYGASDWKGASVKYEEALKSDPADSNALYAMGVLREAQNNAAEAQSFYQKAAEADAVWTRPLMKLAALANAAGDRAAASTLLTRVVSIDAASADGQSAAALLKQ